MLVDEEKDDDDLRDRLDLLEAINRLERPLLEGRVKDEEEEDEDEEDED